MTWFFIALIAPAFWGLGNFIDKYLIEKYFKGDGTGALLIFSSLTSVVVLPFFLIFVPSVFSIPLLSILFLVLNGIFGVLLMIPYLYALKYGETSDVVPIYQCIPVFSYLLGFFFLGENLTIFQILGMIMIIFGAIGISIKFSDKISFNKKPFFLIILASVCVAFFSLIFKSIAVSLHFGVSLFWNYVGYAFCGLILVVFVKSYRKQFFLVFKLNKKGVIGLNLINEILALGAETGILLASLMAPLALVWSVNGFQPILVLIYSVILSVFFPHIIKENINKSNLVRKVGFIFLIFVGAYFLVK